MSYKSGTHNGVDYQFNKVCGFIKTNAEINSGISGGPVFDSNNKVVGIASGNGISESISLVGGVNGMHYVIAPEQRIASALSAKGLKAPSKIDNIAVHKGTHTKMPNFAYCKDKLVNVNTVSIDGVIKSADTGRPIKGAVIYLSVYDTSIQDYVLAANATTNSKGVFVLDPAVEINQEYMMGCQADGYNAFVEVVNINKDSKGMVLTLAKYR